MCSRKTTVRRIFDIQGGFISAKISGSSHFEKKEVSHITLVDIFPHVHYNKHKKNTLGIPNGLIQHMNEAQSGCVHEQVAKADCECPLDYGF